MGLQGVLFCQFLVTLLRALLDEVGLLLDVLFQLEHSEALFAEHRHSKFLAVWVEKDLTQVPVLPALYFQLSLALAPFRVPECQHCFSVLVSVRQRGKMLGFPVRREGQTDPAFE